MDKDGYESYDPKNNSIAFIAKLILALFLLTTIVLLTLYSA